MSTGSDAILERMMALHPKVIDLTLDRVWRLLEALGNPQRNLPPVIHIAGTNGKGSTLAFLRTLAEAEGLRVHAYTSPHLCAFHERIRLAGQLIDEALLLAYLKQIKDANKSDAITFFEITTCAAFLAFAESPADILLLETGLGGRLDATNVIESPALTLITPIDMDHQDFLGNSLSAIAREKAGIMKRNTKCLSAPQHKDVKQVLDQQALSIDIELSYTQPYHGDMDGFSLSGHHQRINAGLALAAAKTMGWSVSPDVLTQTQWPGRWQTLAPGRLDSHVPKGTRIIIDGGHNVASAKVLAHMIQEQLSGPVHMIVGMINTKEMTGYLTHLLETGARLTCLSIPEQDHSIAPATMADRARALGYKAQTAISLEVALARTNPLETVLICGSLYLAGYVLREHGTLPN